MQPVKQIIIYTTTYCGYCTAAKHLLENHELPFTEIDVTNDDEKRKWLLQVTGYRTVPQIFIDGKSIGGYSELSELLKRPLK